MLHMHTTDAYYTSILRILQVGALPEARSALASELADVLKRQASPTLWGSVVTSQLEAAIELARRVGLPTSEAEIALAHAVRAEEAKRVAAERQREGDERR